jgi:hypothetical protein
VQEIDIKAATTAATAAAEAAVAAVMKSLMGRKSKAYGRKTATKNQFQTTKRKSVRKTSRRK